jgi:hypothetical protein
MNFSSLVGVVIALMICGTAYDVIVIHCAPAQINTKKREYVITSDSKDNISNGHVGNGHVPNGHVSNGHVGTGYVNNGYGTYDITEPLGGEEVKVPLGEVKQATSLPEVDTKNNAVEEENNQQSWTPGIYVVLLINFQYYNYLIC